MLSAPSRSAGAERQITAGDRARAGTAAPPAVAPESTAPGISAPRPPVPHRALALSPTPQSFAGHASPFPAPERGPQFRKPGRNVGGPRDARLTLLGWGAARSLVRGTRRKASLRAVLLRSSVCSRAPSAPFSRLARRRRRHDAAGQAALEARPRARSTGSRAAAAGLGARLGHERQDDDAAMAAEILAARGSARPQRVRREPRLGRRLRAARRRAAPSSGCSRSTRRALPEVARRVRPRALCLGNLFRDQLDRYGELEHVAERWRAARGRAAGDARSSSTPTTRCSASSRRRTGRLVTFGVDDPRHARPSLQHAADSKYCLACGTPYVYAAAYVGHLGDYRCPDCGHARPPLDVARARSSWRARGRRASRS